MQEEEEKTTNETVDINLDVLEEVLGDDTVLIEEEEDLMVKVSVYGNEDDELDIAFTDDDGSW